MQQESPAIHPVLLHIQAKSATRHPVVLSELPTQSFYHLASAPMLANDDGYGSLCLTYSALRQLGQVLSGRYCGQANKEADDEGFHS